MDDRLRPRLWNLLEHPELEMQFIIHGLDHVYRCVCPFLSQDVIRMGNEREATESLKESRDLAAPCLPIHRLPDLRGTGSLISRALVTGSL